MLIPLSSYKFYQNQKCIYLKPLIPAFPLAWCLAPSVQRMSEQT